MRRMVGAVVVMGLIGAWNLTGRWFVQRDAVHDIVPPVLVPAATSPASVPPANPSTTPRGKIAPPPVPASFAANPLVFLSTAPADSLDLLSGVGSVLASRIIDARSARGSFTSWNDVLAVKGIGPRTIALAGTRRRAITAPRIPPVVAGIMQDPLRDLASHARRIVPGHFCCVLIAA
jgi:hypothetical protein